MCRRAGPAGLRDGAGEPQHSLLRDSARRRRDDSAPKGDEVTLNLTIANGRDWTAFSSDVRVAKPATTEVMNFSSGEKARLFDFAILGTGHVKLVACPAGSGTCSASAPEALTFDVNVG